MSLVLILATAAAFAGMWRGVGNVRARKAVIRLLGGGSAPLVCGFATSVLVFAMWRESGFIAEVSDEAAYVLQAEIFAAGEWKLPPRPLPEFFEQEHTFVTPFVAAKYPPGQSLILVPGVWVGFMPLVPLVLVGVAGALTFLLSRKLSSGWVAFLAWAIWVTTPLNLIFLPGYFSETTTLVLWLLGWLALLNRSRGGSGYWILLSATCAAWGLITRPLTGAVYAVIVVIVTVLLEWRRRSTRYMLGGLLVGTAIVCIIPLWSQQTTGDWRVTPLSLYTQMYMPWDAPGFGLDGTPPTRALPPDIARDLAAFPEVHRQHTLSNLPSIALSRLVGIGSGMWVGWRVVLSSFLILGLVFLPRSALVGVGSSVLLFIAYLVYAHRSDWPIYYLEIMPVAAFVTAVGFRAAFAGASRLSRRPRVGRVRSPVFQGLSQQLQRFLRLRGPLSEVPVVTAAALCVILGTLPTVQTYRRSTSHSNPRNAFQAAVENLPTSRNIVFVRFPSAGRQPYLLVRNRAALDLSSNWIVFDRGSENAALMNLTADRTRYLIEAATARVIALH